MKVLPEQLTERKLWSVCDREALSECTLIGARACEAPVGKCVKVEQFPLE